MTVITVRYRFFSVDLRRQFLKRMHDGYGCKIRTYAEGPDGAELGITRVQYAFNTPEGAKAFHKPYEDSNPADGYGNTLNSWGSSEEGDGMSIRADMKREHEEMEQARVSYELPKGGTGLVPPQHLDITDTTLKVACGGGLASDPILMDANGRVLTHDAEAREQIAALTARVEALEAAGKR